MKELEDDVMPSATVDSPAVDEIVTERLGGGGGGGCEGETKGFVAERDEGEDMMVDVVGGDAVDDNHGHTGDNLNSKAGSGVLVEEPMEKETVTRDVVMEEVAALGSGEDVCDASGEISVLASEKVEVALNEDGIKKSVEVSKDVLQENVVTMVAGSDCKLASESSNGNTQVNGGDIGVIDNKEPTDRGLTEEVKEQHVESIEGVADEDIKETEILDSSKIQESTTTTANIGSQEVDVATEKESFASKDEAIKDSVSVDPSSVCCNNQTSSIELINSGTNEVDENSIEESVHPTIEGITEDTQGKETVELPRQEPQLAEKPMKQPMECDQQVADEEHGVNEKVVQENEDLDSSKILEPVGMVVVDEGLATKDEVQDGVSVDPSKVFSDDRSLSTELVDSVTGEIEESSEKESIHPTIELTTNTGEKPVLAVESLNGEAKMGGETDIVISEETETGLTKNKEIIELPTVSVEVVAYGDDVKDEKTGKEDEVSDSVKIPESLSTVNLDPVDVLPAKNEAQEVNGGEVNGFQVPADVFNEANGVTPQDSIFSYEDAPIEREEDVGVDIDEVLGWKDEIPGIDALNGTADFPEKDQRFEINENFEAIVGREENSKSREPIVYGRRAHVEVPLYDDTLDENRSPLLEDENLKIETDSDEEEEEEEEEGEEEEDDDEEEEEEESLWNKEQKVVKKSKGINKNASSVSLCQSRYFKPPKHEGQFSVSDLVWGKVRSHPWWPGQIMDPSDASEKAMKYRKKDHLFVAYFGDRTFAWNSPSVLKPFRPNFSQIEKHTNLDSFKNAVECSLEEVSRRVEFGLACSCVPQDIYKKIEYQVVENSGVRKKSLKRYGKDKSASVNSFEPDKLVDYVRMLAQFPSEGDNMELTMAKAQLLSYGRYKGHRQLTEFWYCGELLEDSPNGVQQEQNQQTEKVSEKKDISLSDLTDDGPDSGDGDMADERHITSKLVSSSASRKRKARDSVPDGSVKRQTIRSEKKASSNVMVSPPKPSFKVGELIRRVASQLTGPPKVEHGQHVDQVAGSSVSLQVIPEASGSGTIVEGNQASVTEMLSQLHLTAQDPMKGYSFLDSIIPFFYDRRAAVFSKSLRQPSCIGKPVIGRKRKASTENKNENVPEEFEFEFDDANDSYWTDRIIQNHSEDQDNQNGGVDYQVVAYEPEKPAKRRRGRSKKKRVSVSDEEMETKEESEVDMRRRLNLATEVIMRFAEGIYFPAEIQLNKMFRRFGPLMESETEVDRQNGRARVVFKRCSDAEVAHNSAGKFNIFGSVNVNYEVNYTPLVSYKPLPLPMDAN